jgi:hypothetical protein
VGVAAERSTAPPPSIMAASAYSVPMVVELSCTARVLAGGEREREGEGGFGGERREEDERVLARQQESRK